MAKMGDKKAFGAEFIGTFTLIFAGVLSGVAVQLQGGSLATVAFAHGLAIAIMATAFGATSGGHFNPAVTVSFVTTGRMKAGTAFGYIVSQLAGAAAAAYTVAFVTKGLVESPGGTPAHVVSVPQAIVAEALFTAFLVIAIYGTAVDKRAPKMGALYIGLSIVMAACAIGPITGACLNPARWFGPALAEGHWSDALVYLVGPLLGGLAGGFLYDAIGASEPAAA